MSTQAKRYNHQTKQKSGPQHQREATTKPPFQKIVRRRYNVTPQTAYHIQQLAFQEGTTEGHIIDKLMRNYLADINRY